MNVGDAVQSGGETFDAGLQSGQKALVLVTFSAESGADANPTYNIKYGETVVNPNPVETDVNVGGGLKTSVSIQSVFTAEESNGIFSIGYDNSHGLRAFNWVVQRLA